MNVVKAHELKAENLTNLTLKTLEENYVNAGNISSLCYDCAAVMKSYKGGVRALIRAKLGREISYVHCSNHQLHLIVVDLVEKISNVQQYFDYCAEIYKLFSTFKFKSYYGGHRTTRLLEQRWSSQSHRNYLW